MPWARYDDEFPMNRKVGRLVAAGKDGVAAIGLHLLANTYCRHNGTAGVVEPHVPVLLCGPLGKKLAAMLADVGMFDSRAEGGWTIHDYAEFHDPSDPEPDRSAADRKKELSEKRAESGRLGGLAKAKQRSSKATDLLLAKGVAKEWQSSSPDPDPDPVPLLDTDSPPPRPVSAGGGERSVDKRTKAVIAVYARIALERAKTAGTNITSDDGYMRKASSTCKAQPDLKRYVNEYPDAPADAIAAWLHGDKHSMSYYERVDLSAPDADVVQLDERRPA